MNNRICIILEERRVIFINETIEEMDNYVKRMHAKKEGQ